MLTGALLISEAQKNDHEEDYVVEVIVDPGDRPY